MNELAHHANPHVWQTSPPSTEPPRFGPARLVEILSGRLGQTATFASREHFNLQTARSITVAESNGQASIYLAAVSTNLIALAFIGSFAGLLLQPLSAGSLAVILPAGATVDAAAALIQRRRRRLVLEGYSPDAIDLPAIFIPEPQQAEAA